MTEARALQQGLVHSRMRSLLIYIYIYIYLYILIDDFLASKSVKKKYHLILPSISYQYYPFLKFKLLIWSFNN